MRKITREKVMELLYLLDIHRQVSQKENLLSFFNTIDEKEKIQELVNAEKSFLLNDKDDIPYFEATFSGIVDHLDEIDQLMQKYMKSTWSIEQIGFVERAILRLAIYELNWSEEEGLVTQVIIASALEIAEKYTDENSVKFIHGILGAMTKNHAPKQVTKQKHQGYKKMDKNMAKENILKYKKMKGKNTK